MDENSSIVLRTVLEELLMNDKLIMELQNGYLRMFGVWNGGKRNLCEM